ncbi:polysaccharide deacetylase family protein [Streptomyces sp. BE303]|uniref:polysaccharide deacetylase family protein n=1 Tax=Streptomyces sp. BE303 TaxID=3002528 RepID=UPI002E774BF3|nr:polysaccharide deacetylase family protein [Streptomyces sp. BE303]MED7952915.1 polysaccharide deacetylase family protein [Streptomyces sp. BE303]
MRFAGVGLTRDGYRIAVLDTAVSRPATVEVYEHCVLERPVARLVELAQLAPDGFAVVVDSGNGIFDGSLVSAGVTVFRADPPVLTDGRVTAEALAELGRSRPEALVALGSGGWTMSGREEGITAAERASGPVERRLAAEGRLLLGGPVRRTEADGGAAGTGAGSAPMVALTFDDGPDPEFTPQVLDVLRRYDAPAAFFCIGLHVLAHPGVVRRTAAEGHTLGNHSWSHAYLPDLGPIGLREQLGHTSEALAEAAGLDGPVGWLRPPYGGRSPELLDTVADLGLTTVLWDVETNDWALPGPEVIAERVFRQVRPGSVVLMHDGGGDRAQTVAALPTVITGLRERGYRLVGLGELLAARVPAGRGVGT